MRSSNSPGRTGCSTMSRSSSARCRRTRTATSLRRGTTRSAPAELCAAAGRHFNRGQRAFFFALGYLGWFISPWLFMAATLAVVIVMWRRQFKSDSAAGGDAPLNQSADRDQHRDDGKKQRPRSRPRRSEARSQSAAFPFRPPSSSIVESAASGIWFRISSDIGPSPFHANDKSSAYHVARIVRTG